MTEPHCECECYHVLIAQVPPAAMSALINPALDIAQAVGDLAGVPYLSTAITLVKCIKDNCEKVPVRKVRDGTAQCPCSDPN